MFKKVTWIILVIVISGLSGIVADRYFFPYLSSTKFFTKHKLLKKSAEDVTVINKTEQVYVKEDTSVAKITNQVASSVVNIVSYDNFDPSNKTAKNPKAAFKNGTGIIVTSDGIIMTYVSAIIAENAKYKILTSNSNTYDAEILGIDSYSNLAFLKINASNLPVVSFGNSDEFTSGEKVIAIGNDMAEYQNKYSSGLLNNYNATFNLSGGTLSSSEKLEGVIEANFNSEEEYVGGPVVDYSGQVIGVTGMIEKDNKQIFFQLPSNKVKIVLDKAIKKQLLNNAQLGIYYVPITKTYALANNLSTEKGALIFSPSGQQGLAIISGTPAAKAGLKINDIITKINNDDVSTDQSLSDLLYEYKKGDQIELTIIRDGGEIKVKIQL